jgi:hypothetical protein
MWHPADSRLTSQAAIKTEIPASGMDSRPMTAEERLKARGRPRVTVIRPTYCGSILFPSLCNIHAIPRKKFISVVSWRDALAF